MDQKHIDQGYVKEVFSDEVFVKSLLELETPLEVQAALQEKGIEMTESEILALRDEIEKLAERVRNGEELSLDQLDDVAGGAVPLGLIFLAVTGIGVAVTTGAGAILGVVVGAMRW